MPLPLLRFLLKIAGLTSSLKAPPQLHPTQVQKYATKTVLYRNNKGVTCHWQTTPNLWPAAYTDPQTPHHTTTATKKVVKALTSLGRLLYGIHAPMQHDQGAFSKISRVAAAKGCMKTDVCRAHPPVQKLL